MTTSVAGTLVMVLTATNMMVSITNTSNVCVDPTPLHQP